VLGQILCQHSCHGNVRVSLEREEPSCDRLSKNWLVLSVVQYVACRYVAPEYAKTGMLNERSDVYNFGVLVMEAITGRAPVNYTRPADEVSISKQTSRHSFY
jgi:hypothetical protein